MNLRGKNIGVSGALFLVFVAAVFPNRGAGGERFDGKWLTTVSCEASRDALGYSYRFVSEVKDGKLRGLHGLEGKPGSLLIEGKIAADGTVAERDHLLGRGDESKTHDRGRTHGARRSDGVCGHGPRGDRKSVV